MVRSAISFQVPHHKSECPFYRTVQFSKGNESADLYPASSPVHGDFSITELPVSSILSVRHRIDSSSSPLGSFEVRLNPFASYFFKRVVVEKHSVSYRIHNFFFRLKMMIDSPFTFFRYVFILQQSFLIANTNIPDKCIVLLYFTTLPTSSVETLHRRSHLNQITVQIIKTNYFLSPTVHHEAINILNRRI